MVLLMLCLHLNSFAQHISMQLKNVTVKQAIETIQKQNGYSFTFAASDLNTQKIITVTARNLPIEKVVEQILIGQNVSYTVQGKDIIIKKKSNQATQQKKKSTISGIITICKMMPGTAFKNAPATKACQPKPLPAMPRMGICTIPQTMRPPTIAVSRLTYTDFVPLGSFSYIRPQIAP